MGKNFVLVLLAMFFLLGGALAANFDVNNFSYDPAPASPGKQISLWVNLKNTTNYNVDNVAVTFIPNYPFAIVPGQETTKNFGSVNAYQIIGLYTKVLVDEKAANDDYRFEMRVKDNTEGEKTINVIIRVVGKNPRVELIQSSAVRAVPGQELPLDLKLKNIGGSVAKNVVVKIKEDRTVTTTGVVVEREIIPLGASAALTDNLKPDEEATVRMLLGINKGATLKNYSLPVTVEYYDENGTAFSSTGYIGLNVSAETELDAVINSVNPSAYPGGTSEIGVDIFNVGAASASYVVAELSLENAEFSESKIFVGTLDPDDFDSFKTKAKISDSAKPGTYNLQLKLSFKNWNNETKTIQKSIPIKIVTAGESQAAGGQASSPIVEIIGLLLELVGLFVAAKWVFNKAKKKFGK